VNETLRSAIHLLEDSPDDLQQLLLPSVTKMIEQALSLHFDPPGEATEV
jgi:hypothetical protein